MSVREPAARGRKRRPGARDCNESLVLAGTASAHTGTAAPTCTSFDYSLIQFGPFANAAAYDVQGPAGQIAAGSIGPFGASASGTIAYPAPIAGSGSVRVFLAWDLPDDTHPRAPAGEASVTCPAPPAPPAPPALSTATAPPAAPVAPASSVPPAASTGSGGSQRQAGPRSVVVTGRCRGPWAARPSGVAARRGEDGRWYGYRTARIVTRRGGEVVRVRVVRSPCGPVSVAVTG